MTIDTRFVPSVATLALWGASLASPAFFGLTGADCLAECARILAHGPGSDGAVPWAYVSGYVAVNLAVPAVLVAGFVTEKAVPARLAVSVLALAHVLVGLGFAVITDDAALTSFGPGYWFFVAAMLALPLAVRASGPAATDVLVVPSAPGRGLRAAA